MRILIVLFGCLVIAGAAAAREVQITVYNDDLGLVRDVRDLEFPAGGGEVSVTDVAARIDPTSVHLISITRSDGLAVFEQNYRYDLASPDRILERYLDSSVQAILEGESCTTASSSPSPTSSSSSWGRRDSRSCSARR